MSIKIKPRKPKTEITIHKPKTIEACIAAIRAKKDIEFDYRGYIYDPYTDKYVLHTGLRFNHEELTIDELIKKLMINSIKDDMENLN